MREINISAITETVAELCIQACYNLSDDVIKLIEAAREREESPFGARILEQLLENIDASRRTQLPLCQDTGMAVVFLQIGQDVQLQAAAWRKR